MVIWIIFALIIILLLAAIAYHQLNNKKFEPDYYSLFVIGITWLPLGLVLKNNFFFILGLAFLGVGLANKDKWKKPKKFSQLSKKDKNSKLIFIGILSLLFLVAVAVFFFFSK